MPDSFDIKLHGASKPPDLNAVPPPPLEVKIRTLKSDLESLSETGGNLPAHGRIGKIVAVKLTPAAVAAKKKESRFVYTATIVAGLALIGGIAYIAYRLVSDLNSQSGTPPFESPAATGTSPTQNTAPTGALLSFTHRSLFRTPADEALVLNIPSSAGQAADLQTFNQRLLNLLKSVKPTSTLIEINVEDMAGNSLTVSDIWFLAGTDVIDPSLLVARFGPDVTCFVYRDKVGFWPGYILSLRPGQNWLFVSSDVQKLESSPELENFYLGAAGAPSSRGFVDGKIGSQSVRMLSFTNPSSTFVYGWFGNDLILSTSPDGLGAALSRL